MGLLSGVSNFLSGGARDEAASGYDQANRMLRPYQTGGAADYNNYRNFVGQNTTNLQPYANAGSYQYDHINQGPEAYYNQIMQGYNESPQARYEREQALRASNAGGAASGMLGSGASMKALQENAADVSARDQQRYFQNVGNANSMQMGWLQNLNGRQDQNNAMQQYLTTMGYNGSNMMGQNRVNRGLSNATYDSQVMPTIGGFAGLGAGNLKGNMAANASPDATSQIPWYLMFA